MYKPNPYDPVPPLDRRWQRATYLVGRGLPPDPAVDDPWVIRAVGYLSGRAADPDGPSRYRPEGPDPAIAAAAVLRRLDPPHLRWAVEARHLAEEAYTDIDRKCGLGPGTAAAYEALHFAVRDRLDSPTWIACVVLGPRFHRGPTEADPEIVWKWAAFLFGPVVLDQFLHQAPGLPRAATGDGPDVLLLRATSAAARRKELVAAQVLPVTPSTAARVLALLSRGRTTAPASPPAGVSPAAGGLPDVSRLLEGLSRTNGAAAACPRPRKAAG